MSCCRRSAFSRRIEATSRWLSSIGPTAPSSSRSVPSRMFASGVLSSCDMWRRNRFRSRAMSSRRVRSHSSWRPRAERSAGPLIAIACEKAPRPRSLIARSMARSGRSTKNQKMPATASAAGTRPMIASSRPCCVAFASRSTCLRRESMPRRVPRASRLAAPFSVSNRPTTDPGRPPVASPRMSAAAASPAERTGSMSVSGT